MPGGQEGMFPWLCECPARPRGIELELYLGKEKKVQGLLKRAAQKGRELCWREVVGS